jgi:hypothetical protein
LGTRCTNLLTNAEQVCCCENVAAHVADDNIHLSDDKATYLTTLYGKALDARSPNPTLGDTFADAAVR